MEGKFTKSRLNDLYTYGFGPLFVIPKNTKAPTIIFFKTIYLTQDKQVTTVNVNKTIWRKMGKNFIKNIET